MEDHAFRVFELKLDYLKSQFDRLLNRFNFFLTVETALFGFLGWLVFEKANVASVRVPAILGVMVSILWYIVAAEDRALVQEYRRRVDESVERFGELAGNHPAKEVGLLRYNLLSWYWPPLSVTRMPVLTALVTLVIWLLLLMFGPAWLAPFAPGSLPQPTPEAWHLVTTICPPG